MPNNVNSTKRLKDFLDEAAVREIAKRMQQSYSLFEQSLFIQTVLPKLSGLSLTQRVYCIANALFLAMPDDEQIVITTIDRLLIDWHELGEAGWQNYQAWPVIEYAGLWGLIRPKAGLTILKKLTPLFSAEFAIRPYIEQHFDLTYQTLLTWTQDNNDHVRRLASECIRPRLPWAKKIAKLQDVPQDIIKLLSYLKDDHSRYVQKSVANNLNDISKTHPELLMSYMKEWSVDPTPQRQWIIRHALRSLIKQGELEVFCLLGMSGVNALSVDFQINKREVELNEVFSLYAVIRTQADKVLNLIVDYRIWHQKANGRQTAKVFKWKTVTLLPNEMMTLEKQHVFKTLTTRQYYAGNQRIEIMINGQILGQDMVCLLLPE